jgi:hypothetical protein
MVEALSRLQASQSQGGERIRAATAAIRNVANEHREAVGSVEHAVEELSGIADNNVEVARALQKWQARRSDDAAAAADATEGDSDETPAA